MELQALMAQIIPASFRPNLTTLPNFSVSSSMSFPKSAGDPENRTS